MAERADVIIDFSKYAGKTLYIENRLEQVDGRGPTGKVLAAGQGNLILKIVVDLPAIADNSVDPATITQFYGLPDKTATPRITRTFNFDRSNGNWTINGRSMDPECQEVRARVSKNSVEHWVVTNSSGGWQHPAHIHFEEFQFLSVNGAPPASTGLVLNGRKDVIRLEHNMQTKVFFRFRDFVGKLPVPLPQRRARRPRDDAPVGDRRRRWRQPHKPVAKERVCLEIRLLHCLCWSCLLV